MIRSDVENDPQLDSLIERIPPHLYRYLGLSGQRFEWANSLILDSQLYFPQPSVLNDPFDCRLPPSFHSSSMAIEQHWRAVARRNHPTQNMSKHKAAIRRLVAGSKTAAGRARLTEALFQSVDRNGTACFSTDPVNTLMWSYYAEGHTGVAVRFNMDLSIISKIPRLFIPIEVKYQREFPEYNYYKSSTVGFTTTLLGTKALAWSHEKEWRLVLVNKTGLIQLPPDMIDAVVLGLRTPPPAESEVRQWIKKRASHVELLRITHRPGSFDLGLDAA